MLFCVDCCGRECCGKEILLLQLGCVDGTDDVEDVEDADDAEEFALLLLTFNCDGLISFPA